MMMSNQPEMPWDQQLPLPSTCCRNEMSLRRPALNPFRSDLGFLSQGVGVSRCHSPDVVTNQVLSEKQKKKRLIIIIFPQQKLLVGIVPLFSDRPIYF